MKCLREACRRRGTYFPILTFTPDGGLPEGRPPYRLEIPVLICAEDQKSFDAHSYLAAEARETITATLVSGGQAAPDFTIMSIDWKHEKDSLLAELLAIGTGARLSW